MYLDIPRIQDKLLQHKSHVLSTDKERLFKVNLPPSVCPSVSQYQTLNGL